MATPCVFISHSSKDDEFGARLAKDLRRALGDDAAVWYDSQGGLHGGDTWWSKIVQEVASRDIFIIILSPDAMNSYWVLRELDIAVTQRKSIIPLLYRPCNIRADLQAIQIIRFTTPRTYEVAFNELLLALRPPAQIHPTPATSPSHPTKWRNLRVPFLGLAALLVFALVFLLTHVLAPPSSSASITPTATSHGQVSTPVSSAPTALTITPVPTIAPAPCAPGSNGVFAYTKRNYQGKCLLITGNIADLTPLGFAKTLASMRFVGTYSQHKVLELFFQPDYAYHCDFVTTDQPDLGSCIDQVMSIHITNV